MSLIKRGLQTILDWGEMAGFLLIAAVCRLVFGKRPIGWEHEDED